MPEETLTAKLQFQGDRAISGMRRASGAFSKMQAHARMAKEGVQNLKKGFAGFNIVMAGVAAGVAASVKKFADFDGQMGAVKAVLGKEAAPEFENLERLAEKLGATTEFTATQSAEAMESLARAGFKTNQIMSAVPEVLAAASAESMDLGTAADIVASNIKAFHLEASDAARVADTLAFVSSKTNTNMVGLQEGMKFVAPVAKQMGIQIEDTAAALGVLADVGLKGTLAGTGLKNALLKISKVAKGGKVPIGKYSAEIVKTASGGIDLSKTMFNVTAALQKIKEPTARAQAAMKLLGLRGMGSAAAFDALGKNQELVNKLFVKMRERAKGTAKTMAEMRLDTLKGDFKLLESAVASFMTTIGRLVRDFIRPFIRGGEGITKTIGDAGKAITKMWGAKGELGRAFMEQDLITQGANKTIVEFARGFVEGIKSAKNIFGIFVDALKLAWKPVKALFAPLGLLGSGGSGVKGVTKLAIQAVAIGVAIKTATSLFSRFATVVKGSVNIIKGALGGIKGAVTGTVNLLATKFPKLAKVLPPGMRKLTGAVAAAEKITAQPVRIVNFDEMVGVPGAPGTPPVTGPTTAAEMKRETTKVGRATSALGKLAAAAPVGYAAYKFTGAIDEVVDASGKIATAAGKIPEVVGAITALHPVVSGVAVGYAEAFERGTRVGPKESAIRKLGSYLLPGFIERAKVPEPTTEFARVGGALPAARTAAARAAGQRARAEATRRDVEMMIAAMKPMLDKLPTKEEWKAITKEGVTILTINGREVARATAGEKAEAAERTGAPMKSAKPRRAAKS